MLRALQARRTFASQAVNGEIQLRCGESFMGEDNVPLVAAPEVELRFRDADSPDPHGPRSAALVVSGYEQPLPVGAAERYGQWWVWRTALPTPPAGGYVYARLQQTNDPWVFSAPLWFAES